MEHTNKMAELRIGPALIAILVVIVVLLGILGSSLVNIGGDEVGIVEKKVGGGSLPSGRIIAVNSENGIQAAVLAPGWHFWYWPWQYDVTKVAMTEVKPGYVGLILASDGRSLPDGAIYAPEWDNPDEMKSAEYFLDSQKGNGYKGPQLTVLTPGKYRLNTKLFKITNVPITNVKVGFAGVVKSNVGEVADEVADRLVPKGSKGIWNMPLGEGEFYLNTKAYEVTMVSIRQVKVSYTAQVERGEGRVQPLSPITVRSKDGFTFPVDVRITYRIDREDAPRVVAMIGGDDLVLTKLVTPRVRATFRDNAEKVKALDYVQNRSEQGRQSASILKEQLAEYGVTILAISIGNVGDEETLGVLLKTQMDREIALQEQTTFEEQQRAAEKQKSLSKTKQEAEEEKRLATAAYNVQVAQQDKEKMIIDAQADAERVTLLAQAQAGAYKLISDVIGSDNAALIEIMKLVASEDIKITPSVMVGGSSGGMTDALMGTILQGMISKKSIEAQNR